LDDPEMEIRLAGTWMKHNPVETHEQVVNMLPKKISTSIRTVAYCLSGIESAPVMRYVIDKLRVVGYFKVSVIENGLNMDNIEHCRDPQTWQSCAKQQYCPCGMALATLITPCRDKVLCRWCYWKEREIRGDSIVMSRKPELKVEYCAKKAKEKERTGLVRAIFARPIV
jgi:hypothetical protein